MILSGREIERQQRNGRISITPFNPDRVNPNSYNIALADELYEVVGSTEENLIDAAKPTHLQSVIKEGKWWRLLPGRLYLGRTVERTHTNHYVPMIEGRSSIGRLGVFIHSTAGFGDVGFDGFWTLEITVTVPTILYPDMKIAQVFFHAIEGNVSLYDGQYSKNNGVQASGIYKELQ